MALLVIAALGLGTYLLFDNEKHHEQWKKQHPKAIYYPGTIGSNFAILLLGFGTIAVLIAMDPETSLQSILEAFSGTFH